MRNRPRDRPGPREHGTTARTGGWGRWIAGAGRVGQRGGNGSLQPPDGNLNSECRAFAEALRDLFLELALSVRRLAGRCFVSPGPLSRYLAGTRIPQWDFVEDLFKHVEEERGTRIDAEDRDRVRGLRLAALHTSASISQAVLQLEGQLKAADQEARRSSARAGELGDALEDYHHLLADLDLRLRKLETEREPVQPPEVLLAVPVGDRATILAERQALALEVARLSRELGGHICECRIHLRVALDTNLTKDRNKDLGEAVEGLLGLPDVDDAERALALSRDVCEQTFYGPVGWRFHPVLAPRQLAVGLLVLLLCELGGDEDDRHLGPSRSRRRGLGLPRLGRNQATATSACSHSDPGPCRIIAHDLLLHMRRSHARRRGERCLMQY
ncbi:hypothetical protein [Kitasatospora sp. NPDC085879]|uniref:hypothetical protein n=1 Tax=Kitasatospora sp. NPDC085879 TaxID=3154769 RepID=UPI000BB11B5C|nr:hypothetical protein [Streptomyces sp. TLI_235]